jgi:hypothetical protein
MTPERRKWILNIADAFAPWVVALIVVLLVLYTAEVFLWRLR